MPTVYDQDADQQHSPYREQLHSAEQQSQTNSAFDDIVNNYDQDADDSQENANIANAKDKEQAGNGIKVDMEGIKNAAQKVASTAAGGGKFNISFRKAAPTGAIVGAGIIGFALTTFLPAAMPLLAFKQNASDSYADASRAQQVRYKSMLRYVVGNKQIEEACKKPSSIACKLGTMSDTDKNNHDNNKLKVDGTKITVPDKDGKETTRWIVKSVTAPDGTVLNNGDSFISKMATDVQFAIAAKRGHNPRNNVFNGGQFSKNVLPRFGLDKSQVPDLPKDKEEQDKARNKLIGLKEDGTADKDKLKQSAEERSKKGFGNTDTDTMRDGGEVDRGGTKIKVGKGLAAIPGVACMVYNTGRLVVNVAKIERYVYLAQFVMPFWKVADQIRDNGTTSGETVGAFAGQLTARSNKPETKGLSAMDAQSMKMFFGGDEKGLQNYTKDFLLHNNAILKGLDGMIGKVDETIASTPGLGGSTRGMCRMVNSWQGQVIGTAACVVMGAIQGGIGAAGGTVVPVLGNLVGGIGGVGAAAIECTAAVVGGEIIGKGVGYLTEKVIIPAVMEAAVEGLPNATSVGPPVGEGLAIGAAVILNRANRYNGVTKPSTAKSRAAFNAATGETDQLYKQIEVAEASDTPFDVYNRYSFMGSIFASMNSRIFTTESRTTSGNFSFQRLFGAFSLAPSVLAIGESPSPITAEDMGECSDRSLRSIGVECTLNDQLTYDMSPTALTMDIQSNLDYMISHGQIDEDTGEANPDAVAIKIDNSSAPAVVASKPITINGVEYTYEKYVKYCAERDADAGITTEPIESDEFDWAMGTRCTDENEAMANFEAWRSTMVGNADSDYTEEQGNDPSVPAGDGGTIGSVASGDAKALAQKIVDSPNFSGDSRYTKQIKQVAAGDNSCNVDERILRMLATLVDKYKLSVSSLNRRCTGVLTASGTGSLHYANGGGHAVDVNWVNGVHATGGTSHDINYINDALRTFPSGTKVELGQINCGQNGVSVPNGITLKRVNDSCNHVHIGVY